MGVTISQKDYEAQKKAVASNPNVSFGNRDYRSSGVTVSSGGSSAGSSSSGTSGSSGGGSHSSGGSSSSTPSYMEHIQYFGNSPAAYAAAINDAISSGRGLSDPAAAAAFKADYPQYFGSGSYNNQDTLTSIMNELNQPVDMGAIFGQMQGYFPAVQMPPTLSYSEAQQRASDQLTPLWNDTKNNYLKNLQNDQIRRGFFGQAPGAADVLQKGLDLDSKKNAAISGLANDMVGKSESDARAQQQIALQQQAQQSNLLMNAFQQAQQDKQNNLSNLLAILNYQTGQDDKQYDRTYQAGRDAVSDSQWNKTFGLTQDQWNASPEAQDWYLPLTKAGMQADIAARNRSNTGGGSTPKPTYTEKVNNSVADAYSAVNNALSSGYSVDQVVSNIQAQSAELVRQGIDPQKVVDYAYSRAGAYAQPTQNDSWYTSLDKSLGGWLPFGASR